MLGTRPSSRAMDCTPSGASLLPSRRKTAAAREMAGALLASTAFASSRSGAGGVAVVSHSIHRCCMEPRASCPCRCSIYRTCIRYLQQGSRGIYCHAMTLRIAAQLRAAHCGTDGQAHRLHPLCRCPEASPIRRRCGSCSTAIASHLNIAHECIVRHADGSGRVAVRIAHADGTDEVLSFDADRRRFRALRALAGGERHSAGRSHRLHARAVAAVLSEPVRRDA